MLWQWMLNTSSFFSPFFKKQLFFPYLKTTWLLGFGRMSCCLMWKLSWLQLRFFVSLVFPLLFFSTCCVRLCVFVFFFLCVSLAWHSLLPPEHLGNHRTCCSSPHQAPPHKSSGLRATWHPMVAPTTVVTTPTVAVFVRVILFGADFTFWAFAIIVTCASCHPRWMMDQPVPASATHGRSYLPSLCLRPSLKIPEHLPLQTITETMLELVWCADVLGQYTICVCCFFLLHVIYWFPLAICLPLLSDRSGPKMACKTCSKVLFSVQTILHYLILHLYISWINFPFKCQL